MVNQKKEFIELESKVKILDYMEHMKVSPYKASEHFEHKYSARAIYKWKKKSGEIRNTAKYKPKNHTLHQGKKPDLVEIEKQLLEYIALNINAKNPLTIWTKVYIL